MEAKRSSPAAHDQRFVFGQPAPSGPTGNCTVPPPDGQPVLGASAGPLTLNSRVVRRERKGEKEKNGGEACGALGPRGTMSAHCFS